MEYPFFLIPFCRRIRSGRLQKHSDLYLYLMPFPKNQGKGQSIKTKKTRWDKRGTYTFQFNDGTSITLRPGEDGVTEADIKILHSLDDAEVYNNIKNSRPPMTAEEKARKKAWEAEHPGERYPANWNLSFDYMAGDDGDGDKLDKSRILSETCTYMETEDETEKEMLDRILWFLTDIQREVYRLVKIVGHTQTEAADILGTSIPNINKHLKKAVERIEQQKEKM